MATTARTLPEPDGSASPGVTRLGGSSFEHGVTSNPPLVGDQYGTLYDAYDFEATKMEVRCELKLSHRTSLSFSPHLGGVGSSQCSQLGVEAMRYDQ